MALCSIRQTFIENNPMWFLLNSSSTHMLVLKFEGSDSGAEDNLSN